MAPTNERRDTIAFMKNLLVLRAGIIPGIDWLVIRAGSSI